MKTPAASVVLPDHGRQHPLSRLAIALLLFLITAAIYAPLYHAGFVNFDDPDYVTDNPHVTGGLTMGNVAWAFTHSHSNNWHPLTWISHMLDCEWWGLNAGGHHLTSLFFHGANTVLLFLVFSSMTGALWRSAFVAALFAWHPLHVESVAWIAERKDVLSTFFGLFTLWAYANYVSGIRCRVSGESQRANIQHPLPRRSEVEAGTSNLQRRMPETAGHASRITQHGEESTVRSPRSRVWYGCALGLFALGLMSKPMLVTLPFVLLLLDYWPLRRFELSTLNAQPSGGAKRSEDCSTLWRLVREKTPLFLMAAASGVATFVIQQNSGAVKSAETCSLPLRSANALVSYAAYIMKMIWPVKLAVFYPFPVFIPAWQIVSAGLFLIAVTFFAVKLRRSHPYLAVGWFWYLGTLVPVIGLVQVGSQAMADRYTYFPLIGLFLALTWGGWRILEKWRLARIGVVVAAVFLLALLLAGVAKQVRCWQDSIVLFEHALSVTRGNATTHYALGFALQKEGKNEEAIAGFTNALRHNPNFADAHYNLGNALRADGRITEAVAQYEETIRLRPDYAQAHNNLAVSLAEQNRFEEAILHYQKAVRISPDYVDARFNLGNLLFQQGRVDEAIVQYRALLRLKPHSAEVRNNFANLLTQNGQNEEAIILFKEALRIRPGFPEAHYNLANALCDQQGTDEAIGHYTEALRLRPGFVPALNHLAGIRAAHPLARYRDGAQAVALAGRAVELTARQDALALDALAMALAETGQFEQAVEMAQKACELAANQPQLAGMIAQRLELYAKGLPYRMGK